MSARSAVCRAGVASLVLVGLGCGSKRVLVPPRMDLRPYGRIALVTFTVENAKGSLHTLASQRFAEAVLSAQPGLEILELGPGDSLMAQAGEREFGPRSARALGDAHEAPAVFLGHLKVSDVKPSASLFGVAVPRVEAKVTVELTTRLVSTASGGTLWRASATATETVGQLGLSGGQPIFSAEDPNEAYGRLVDYLVRQATWDFRPTWQQP
ncbi:MAG: hypothetical protein ACREMJ_00915 [Gemmatimonadales bacterium]